jgi:hypothetical protein
MKEERCKGPFWLRDSECELLWCIKDCTEEERCMSAFWLRDSECELLCGVLTSFYNSEEIS